MIDIPSPTATRDLHRVSTKAVIFTPDYSQVLVMHMFPNSGHEIYGLPGGHIDAGEVPDDTIIREIDEELGITIGGLRHIDFFVHENGKIVLAYFGTLAHDTEFHPSNPEKEIGEWLTRDEFEKIKIDQGYKKLVLDCWRDMLKI